jgi:hypothetical protein
MYWTPSAFLCPIKNGEIGAVVISDQSVELVETNKSRGAAPKKPRSRVSSLAKGVSGHTVYLPDTLFEQVMVKAHRRKLTISEYVTWVLEGELGLRRKAAAESSDTAA